MEVLDLCAGMGGFSAAFKERGHTVTTLDLFGTPDIKMDVRNFHPTKYYDVILASPPCTDFSKAAWRKGKCKDRKPDLSIVNACLRIIKEGKPKYSAVENPRACLRYFIGPPTCTVNYSDYGHPTRKPTDLWGVFPMFLGYSPVKNIKHWNQTPRSPRKRACIPYGLSWSLCTAIEAQEVGCAQHLIKCPTRSQEVR